MEGKSVGIADIEGAALLAVEGRPDFDGAPVGNILGKLEIVGRLEGNLEGKGVTFVDGRPD